MKRVEESTLKMMKAYPKLFFDEGLTPVEIGEKFGLSKRTVYDHLGEIAEKLGMPRESLLKRPVSKYTLGVKEKKSSTPVDVNEFRENLKVFREDMARLNDSMERTIQRVEDFEEFLEEVHK
ncbi:MAG: hypothetical protein Q4A70_00940 [Candidatus Saccharibacteria bacterium]|nr:hypothetical protein [Candidatus Saccharibacteria bacterium]